MKKRTLDSSLLDRAICFAVAAHANTERREKGFPYIVHPLEAMAIAATMTSDQELLAAAVLHDTIEDTDTTADQLRREFGERVAELVVTESDVEVEGMTHDESWTIRKQGAIDRLATTSRDGKIVALGDKLSNMRAIARDYAEEGERVWQKFAVKEKKAHEWHYRGLAASLSELRGTFTYDEFAALIEQVFG